MSKVFIEEASLSAIGDAIRAKSGSTELLSVPTGMVDAITNLSAGGGGLEFPAVLEMGMAKINERGAFDWLWGMAPQMTILHGGSTDAFTYSQLEDLSHLTIKIGYNTNGVALSNYFNYSSVKTLPNITFLDNGRITGINGFFSNCDYLREIPNDIFIAEDENGESLGTLCFSTDPTTTACRTGSLFNGCKSLRVHPKIHDGIQRKGNSSNSYTYMFYNCHTLDEITDMPVYKGSFTSNTFNKAFSECSRVENIKFAKQADGTPYTAEWNNQTIDLTSYVGYAKYESNITGYNSGITAETQVTDAASYAALKDNEDYWTLYPDFSRYNHDSAVETINSLPDCSAYGTNTIKFKGAAGALTDGGAINTLTEAEIAVATAKGWTVSLI